MPDQTSATTTNPTPTYLDLSPAVLTELYRQMVRSQADQMRALCEVQQALAACRQYPDAETAGDACRLALLGSVRSFAA